VDVRIIYATALWHEQSCWLSAYDGIYLCRILYRFWEVVLRTNRDNDRFGDRHHVTAYYEVECWVTTPGITADRKHCSPEI
jgi:hypothetical protein